MTHAEMMERMSARELAMWRLYDERVEPIGDARADLRAGGIAATVANAMSGREGKAYTAADFALQFHRQTPDEQLANTKAVMGLLTTKKVRRDDDADAL